MPDITTLLQDYWNDTAARDEIHHRLDEQLRDRARACLRGVGPITLSPTGLVNEAVLKLLRSSRKENWKDSKHFFGIMWSAMKQVLIDYLRAKKTKKRGGDALSFELREDDLVDNDDIRTTLAVLDIVEQMTKQDKLTGQILGLFFCNRLGYEEIAEFLRTNENLELSAHDVEKRVRLVRAKIQLALKEERQ